MKIAITFLATAFCLSLVAQNAETTTTDKAAQAPYYLSLTNGKIIHTDNLQFEDSYRKDGVLIVNNKDKYDLDDVKDFKIRNGYYKKMASPKLFSGQETWYRQEDPGKIKVYSRLVPQLVDQSLIMMGDVLVPIGGQTVNKKAYYFQYGDDGPQKFKYKHLLPLVKSNPNSLAMLKKGNGRAWLKAGWFVVGAGLLIKGFSYACNESEVGCAERSKKGTGWAIAGLTLPLVAILVPKPSVKYRESVYLYNKEEK